MASLAMCACADMRGGVSGQNAVHVAWFNDMRSGLVIFTDFTGKRLKHEHARVRGRLANMNICYTFD